jgi:hypothetical protein
MSQIHFVQLQIQAAPNRRRVEKRRIGVGFLAGQVVLVVLHAVAGLAKLVPSICSFGTLRSHCVPVLVRGFVWFTAQSTPLAIHGLGKREQACACVFGVLSFSGCDYRDWCH